MQTRIAAIQMTSTAEVAENLAAAGRLIAEAADGGARLVGLPENFYLFGRRESDKVEAAEAEGDGPIQNFLAETARRHGIWLVAGTAPLRSSDPARIRSACLVYDANGGRVARYDKMHLFRFEGGKGERYDEGRAIEAGSGLTLVESPYGRIALSVCYDMRFPELYRALGSFEIAFMPSAFTVPTGSAHWHLLLRARAVENLCYVVAPAQGGEHAGGRRTYGHALIVDPWGTVLAERAEGEGVVLADMDTDRLAEFRRALPALEHRRIVLDKDQLEIR